MSSAGLSLDQYLQLQDAQKRQQMGQALLGRTAGQMNASNGGLANVGNDILGTVMAAKAQNDRNNMLNQIQYQNQPNVSAGAGQTQGLMGPDGRPLAGSQINIGNISGKTPLLQSNGNWLSNLFSFGGSS